MKPIAMSGMLLLSAASAHAAPSGSITYEPADPPNLKKCIMPMVWTREIKGKDGKEGW